mgnify:CR=1 FL=1|tara:strand:+ start:920 stop:1933 length:1014 start_codon:yes stop_codon:yes gene_type:complete
MPKISSYRTATPALTDKLIGSDANSTPTNATKNFTVESVTEITKNTILPETTTETPVLTDKVFGSNDSGNPRTANRNFTLEGVRDTIIPQTTAGLATLSDRLFAANPSEANPRIADRTFTIDSVKNAILPVTGLQAPAFTDKIFATDVASPRVPNQHFTLQGVKDLIAPCSLILNSASTVDQELSAANTKTLVAFGSAVDTNFVQLNVTGDVIIKLAGSYSVRVAINCGCNGITSQINRHIDYYFSVDKDGTQAFQTAQNTVYFDRGDTDPAQTLIAEYPFYNIAANTTLQFYWSGSYYSPAVNPGIFKTALVNRPTGTTGMLGVPSAHIQITRLSA